MFDSSNNTSAPITGYKRAHDCKHCPQRNDAQGCPCWLELMGVNSMGQPSTRKGCSHQLMPILLVEILGAVSTLGIAIDQNKNTVVAAMGSALTHGLAAQEQLVEAVLTALPPALIDPGFKVKLTEHLSTELALVPPLNDNTRI